MNAVEKKGYVSVTGYHPSDPSIFTIPTDEDGDVLNFGSAVLDQEHLDEDVRVFIPADANREDAVSLLKKIVADLEALPYRVWDNLSSAATKKAHLKNEAARGEQAEVGA